MKCETCAHYGFYQMITQGPYTYSDKDIIPCITCSQFSPRRDNYEPMPIPPYLLPRQCNCIDGIPATAAGCPVHPHRVHKDDNTATGCNCDGLPHMPHCHLSED